jgi:hypothetical protein
MQVVPVHEAPIDDDEPPAPQAEKSDASKEPQPEMPELPEETVPAQRPQPPKPGTPLPVGAIVMAVLFIIVLSAITVMVYLQS